MFSEISLANAIKDHLGNKEISVRDVTGQQLVKDATFKFLVLDKSGQDTAFVLMANEHYPDAVELAVKAAQNAAVIVGTELAEMIVVPTAMGYIGSNSYAVFPYLSPLKQGKVGRVLARQQLVGKVCDWLERVAVKTTRKIPEERIQAAVVAPLQWLNTCPGIPAATKTDALSALSALDANQWQPHCVFSHNDLWAGNVLTSANAGKFLASYAIGEPRIIDWLSSSEEGIPGYDLINYTASTGYSKATTSRYLQQINNQTDRNAIGTYYDLLAGFGRLGLNRGEFPLERFIALLESVVNNYRELADIKN